MIIEVVETETGEWRVRCVFHTARGELALVLLNCWLRQSKGLKLVQGCYILRHLPTRKSIFSSYIQMFELYPVFLGFFSTTQK